MKILSFAALPAEPPGIAEWENLLVRVELGPRAVRIAVDGADPVRLASARDRQGRSVADHLSHLAHREAEAAGWLEAMRTGGGLELAADPPPNRDDRADGRVEVDRWVLGFAERRARNFATVQRRGLEVWAWRAEHPGHGPLSAYRLFGYLAAHDGRHLAAIRALLREGG